MRCVRICLAGPAGAAGAAGPSAAAAAPAPGELFLVAARFFDREAAGHLRAADLDQILTVTCTHISREPCAARPLPSYFCGPCRDLNEAILDYRSAQGDLALAKGSTQHGLRLVTASSCVHAFLMQMWADS